MDDQPRQRGRPRNPNSNSEKELDRVEQQFDIYEKQVQDLTLDRMNMAPVRLEDPQIKMSSREIARSKDVYLKPFKTISSREKFNEEFRDAYNRAKEYVQFVAENKEVIGEIIDMWTKPFPGLPAEWWKVPVNTPIWAPKYVKNQIKNSRYHRLKSEERVMTDSSGEGQYYGGMVVDTTIQRLDTFESSDQFSLTMR